MGQHQPHLPPLPIAAAIAKALARRPLLSFKTGRVVREPRTPEPLRKGKK